MLGFYVLLEDPDANVTVIIALALHSAQCTAAVGFLKVMTYTMAVIDLYEPVSDSILKPDLVSWYK